MAKTLKKIEKPDYDYLTTEVVGGELRRLMETLRSDVETFYARGSFNQTVSNMNQQAAEAERKQKELESTDLQPKSDDEVIKYLSSKEQILVGKALAVLVDRIQSGHAYNLQHLVLKIRGADEVLVRILGTKDMVMLEHALILFSAILDDGSHAHHLKKLGAIRPIAKILAAPELVDNYGLLQNLLNVVVRAVRFEGNRDLFRTVNGMGRLTQFLSQEKHPEAQQLTTEALFHLSAAKDNKVPLVKAGIFDLVLQNLKGIADTGLKRIAVGVLRNLSETQLCQEHVQMDDFRILLMLMDPARVYRDQTATAEYQSFIQLQYVTLELITELGLLEQNQKTMGNLAVVKTLVDYLYPMNPGVRAKWDMELLKRVLQAIGNVVQHATNRNTFLEMKGAHKMTQICQTTGLFNQECIIEAASVLTTCCTKASLNQQNYHKLGVQILMNLVTVFSTVVEVNEFCSVMINVAASKGINKKFLVEEGADALLIRFIQNSRESAVLINACDGLGHLCTEPPVVKAVIDSNIIKTLVSFLGLQSPELSTNVARVLASVADGEGGTKQIVAAGGVLPLVKLIGRSQPNEVKEQALLAFGKIFFCPGGQENIGYFFAARGEGPLLECLFSDAEEVQVPSASIVHGVAENREVLRMAKVEEKLAQLEGHPNVAKEGSQVANFLQLIKVHLKKDATTAKLASTAIAEKEKEKRQLPKIWMKAIYEYKAKMLPMRETMQYTDFISMIVTEFGIEEWAGLNLKTSLTKEEIRIVDQNRLDFLITCIQKDESAHLIIHAKNPTLPFNPNSAANKLDGLLAKLDHRQLRGLLKQAIEQEIDLTEPIRNYMNVNRAAFGVWTAPEETEDTTKGPAGKVANRALPKQAPPAPPPPPKLNMASKRGVKATVAAGQETGKPKREEVNFMDALKNAVEAGGGLRKTTFDAEERARRGLEEETSSESVQLRARIEEEHVEESSKGWEIDNRMFLNQIQEAFTKDFQIMNIVFQVIDNEMMDWKDASKCCPSLSPEILAETLLHAGLDVKCQRYKTDANKDWEKEYIAVLCPADLPRWAVLKTISALISENGGVTNVVNQTGTVAWSSKKNAPREIGSLW